MPVVADGRPGVSRDYFDLFQLQPNFDLDLDELAARFRSLQRTFHPDRFASQGAGEKRAAAQLSADINAGYRILKDPVARAGFMLERLGCDLKALEREPVDGAFLMRQMELRDAVQAALRDAPARAALLAQVQGLEDLAIAALRAGFQTNDLAAAGVAWVQLLYIGKLKTEVAASSEPA